MAWQAPCARYCSIWCWKPARQSAANAPPESSPPHESGATYGTSAALGEPRPNAGGRSYLEASNSSYDPTVRCWQMAAARRTASYRSPRDGSSIHGPVISLWWDDLVAAEIELDDGAPGGRGEDLLRPASFGSATLLSEHLRLHACIGSPVYPSPHDSWSSGRDGERPHHVVVLVFDDVAVMHVGLWRRHSSG